ncbi:MAG: hypothetical protein FWD53_10065 [Phycisphaerales bacterium]|nr:hypothetical protein [Phycisphaerales bacterium]
MQTTTTKLVQTLMAQKNLYIQLLDLAAKQSTHVAAGESDPLIAILTARNRIIDQIIPLDRELQPYKSHWQELLDSLPPTDRSIIAGLLKDVQQLLANILAHDERDKQTLERQKQDIGSQITRTVTGTALNRAYGIQR